MLETEKWAEGRPFLIALLGPQAASVAKDLHLAFQHTKERRLLTLQFPLPHLPSWFALYRSHRKASSFLRTLFRDFSLFGPESVELADGVSEYLRLKKLGKAPELTAPTPGDLEEANKILSGLNSASFTELKEDHSNTPPDPEFKEAVTQLLAENEIEGSFFLLVQVPCWLLYRQSPTMLYRRARQGDFESLEKLLRLDPLMIHDPAIGAKIQGFRMRNRRNSYEALMTAPFRKPKARITRKRMKMNMAGFISALSYIIRKPLTEPEIRSLFDANAKDSGIGTVDSDIPLAPESFAKALQRERALWLPVMQSDKTF